MRKLKITLRADGTQQIEVLEAVGEECLRLTEKLERRLGIPLGERTLKPEFYESEATLAEREQVRE